MNKRDLMRAELIGLDVEVASPCHGTEQFTGVVVDETRNTFVIRKGAKEVTIPKYDNEFLFTFEGIKIMIKGSEIQHRPEDRIKKIR